MLPRLSALALEIRGDEADAAEIVRIIGDSGQARGVTELHVSCREDDPVPIVRALTETGGWGTIERLELGFWPGGEVWLPAELTALIVAAPHLRRLVDLHLNAELDHVGLTSLVKAYPDLESLSIGGVTDEAGLALARAELPELRSLTVHPAPAVARNRAEPVAAFLTTPTFPKLAVLCVGDVRFGVTGLGERLAGPFREPTLRYLDLRYSGLGPADAVALARCPALRGLMFLKLEGNPIGSEGAAALAAADWPRLASLQLHSCSIGEDGAAAFARAEMPELQRLDLALNPIGSGGCRALAAGRFPQLRHLDVGRCGADDASLAELRHRFGDGIRGA
jgi:hypothetical protein